MERASKTLRGSRGNLSEDEARDRMWELDYAGLWACLDACSESDFMDEVDFLKRTAHQKMNHPVLICFPKGDKAYVLVKVMLDFFIDYVEVDMMVDLKLLMSATVFDHQGHEACSEYICMIQNQ
tara:strand:- start:724 stop:1095 length:372 start_codon:yes stop_codon:yes gene_type:complete